MLIYIHIVFYSIDAMRAMETIITRTTEMAMMTMITMMMTMIPIRLIWNAFSEWKFREEFPN